jgi:hypothetical protein
MSSINENTGLPHYVRFRDLRAAGIVDNWQQLFRLIEDYGFPSGQLLSPNVRAWDRFADHTSHDRNAGDPIPARLRCRGARAPPAQGQCF